MIKKQSAKAVSTVAFLTAASQSHAANKRLDKFLADLKSDDAEVRYSAVQQARSVGAKAVLELGKLLVSDNPGIAKSAGEALRVLVHSAAKNWDRKKRKNVMNSLIKLTKKDQAQKTRIEALRHLSTIGDADATSTAAELLTDKALREEAIFCLERIPGEKSTHALLKALKDAPKEFKPRIIAALGHRKDPLAQNYLANEMGAYDTSIAIPAMKAVASIGKLLEGDVDLPNFETLSNHDKAAFTDSMLRYFDAQITEGNIYDAEEALEGILGYVKKEHYICAIMVSLGKTGTSSAASIILPELSNDSPKVQHAAKEALIGMKGAPVDEKLKSALKTVEGKTKKAIQSIIEARQ
jgi:HEAT repeat protein